MTIRAPDGAKNKSNQTTLLSLLDVKVTQTTTHSCGNSALSVCNTYYVYEGDQVRIIVR